MIDILLWLFLLTISPNFDLRMPLEIKRHSLSAPLFTKKSFVNTVAQPFKQMNKHVNKSGGSKTTLTIKN